MRGKGIARGHPSRRGLRPLLRMRSVVGGARSTIHNPHGEERRVAPRLEPWRQIQNFPTELHVMVACLDHLFFLLMHRTRHPVLLLVIATALTLLLWGHAQAQIAP